MIFIPQRTCGLHKISFCMCQFHLWGSISVAIAIQNFVYLCSAYQLSQKSNGTWLETCFKINYVKQEMLVTFSYHCDTKYKFLYSLKKCCPIMVPCVITHAQGLVRKTSLKNNDGRSTLIIYVGNEMHKYYRKCTRICARTLACVHSYIQMRLVQVATYSR